jgi:hypothetical protein
MQLRQGVCWPAAVVPTQSRAACDTHLQIPLKALLLLSSMIACPAPSPQRSLAGTGCCLAAVEVLLGLGVDGYHAMGIPACTRGSHSDGWVTAASTV